VNRRVAMVVRNAVTADSRVRKSAAALAAAGWDVTVVGTSPDAQEHRLELDGVPVVLVPVRPSLTAADAQVLARRDAALRPGRVWPATRPISWPVGPVRRAARTLAGALTPSGGWRRLDPWVQAVEIALAPVVEALDPVVIHAHDHHTAPLAARSAAVLRRRGPDTVWLHDAHELSARTADRGAGGMRGLLRRRMIAGMLAELVPTAAAVITVSDELAGRLQADLRLRERPTVVLNAPPVAHARSAPSLRERAGVGPQHPLLVYAGGLAPARGLDLAVRALPRLPGVHLALVAPDDEPNLPALRALAAQLSVADRLHVVPYVAPDEVVDHVRGADAGLVPLRHRANHEISLVTKYLEYVQAGVPLVVSDVRTMAAFTREHGLGEVFGVGAGDEPDAAALAAAAARVLADPERYRTAYRAARPVLDTLTWEAQTRALTALYERVAPPSPGGAVERAQPCPNRSGGSLR
jgi:glycogen synthase